MRRGRASEHSVRSEGLVTLNVGKRPRDVIIALLSARNAEATVCPSEAARRLAIAQPSPADWRSLMPDVHAAVDRMVAEGEIRLSWKGQPLALRTGPYRIHSK